MHRSEPVLRFTRGALVVLAASAAVGCIDFGYVAPPAAKPDAGEIRDAGPSDGGCVEGPAVPSNDGPHVQFYALDVDARLLNIRSGETVTWTNGSPMSHTATAGLPSAPITIDNGGFDSGNLAAGGSRFAWTFCTERTIEWFCRVHPAQMFGYQIVVGP